MAEVIQMTGRRSEARAARIDGRHGGDAVLRSRVAGDVPRLPSASSGAWAMPVWRPAVLWNGSQRERAATSPTGSRRRSGARTSCGCRSCGRSAFRRRVPMAMRVATYAAEQGRGAAFAIAAGRLAFCGGFDIEDPDMLAEAAAAAGLEVAEALDAAKDDRNATSRSSVAGRALWSEGVTDAAGAASTSSACTAGSRRSPRALAGSAAAHTARRSEALRVAWRPLALPHLRGWHRAGSRCHNPPGMDRALRYAYRRLGRRYPLTAVVLQFQLAHLVVLGGLVLLRLYQPMSDRTFLVLLVVARAARGARQPQLDAARTAAARAGRRMARRRPRPRARRPRPGGRSRACRAATSRRIWTVPIAARDRAVRRLRDGASSGLPP